MKVDEFSAEILMDHYRTPTNYRKGSKRCQSRHGANPVCNDRITLYLYIDANQIVEEVTFTGCGCVLSIASTSIMIQLVEGKLVSEVIDLVHEFLESMCVGRTTNRFDSVQSLQVLTSVSTFPARVSCVVLSWKILNELIHSYRGISKK